MAQIGLLPGCASTQGAGGVNVHVPTQEMLDDAVRRTIAEAKKPDSSGTGTYRVTKHVLDTLPSSVVYQPTDLSAVTRPMPVYVFGNGACSTDGAKSRHHLLEIASHGYLAISPGGIYSGPDIKMTPESIRSHDFKADPLLIGQAVDWAIRENSRAGSPFYGKIDTSKIVLSGYSCGGYQVLGYAGDPRVSSYVILNSGVFPKAYIPMDGAVLGKEALNRITVPILYVTGGPEDVAYSVARDDVRRIHKAPVIWIDTPATHAGTFAEPNGGRVAQAVVQWLDWTTRGDKQAAAWFTGPDCTLCTSPQWTVTRRNQALLGKLR
ncbi:MAG: hypothetical protein J0G94_10300 [Sphingomonadales bacterium]|nr:hypothetical protein [Sphingomonadales bacterium]